MKGWFNNSMGHSLASKGIKMGSLNDIETRDPDVIYGIMKRFRTRVKNKNDINKYNIEFIKELKDLLGVGENYQVNGHSVLLYNDVYIDGNGVYTKDQLEKKFNSKVLPEKENWKNTYNKNALELYRKWLLDSYEEYKSDSRMVTGV